MAKSIGFEFECVPTGEFEATWGGVVTYHDHGSTFIADNGKKKKLAFQAVVPPTVIDGEDSILGDVQPCDLAIGDYLGLGYWEGDYTPIPANAGLGGTFNFIAVDSGIKGPDKGDWLSIKLEDGVLDGYENEGSPGGGNIHLP